MLKKQYIIRGIYTAWNVTKILYALNRDATLVTVLDENIYWSDDDRKGTDVKQGVQLQN